MNYKDIFYPESKFGGFSNIDGAIIFFLRVNSFVNSSSIFLDIGCGRGTYSEDPVAIRRDLRIFNNKCNKVIGIDVDQHAAINPYIDEFYHIADNKLPIDDNSIDVALCNAVLEHIKDPELFFSECKRVIKVGGYLCINTGNLWSYPGMCASLIPNKWHDAILKKVQPGRKSHYIYPTYYNCNTIWKIRKILTKYSFDHCVYGYEAEPGYLNFNLLFYYLGVLHQRFSPKLFKPAIHAFGKKKSSEIIQT